MIVLAIVYAFAMSCGILAILKGQNKQHPTNLQKKYISEVIYTKYRYINIWKIPFLEDDHAQSCLG